MSTGRNTTVRDRDRRTIARTKPPCALCGEPIDYSLHWRHPMSFTVDHIVPIGRGGPDTLANKQAAHRACNRLKSDRLDEELHAMVAAGSRTFVTARTW